MKPTNEACVCSQLRRTARLISLFYDAALTPAGMSVNQYALLVRIGRTDGLSRTALASQLGMERTTLTRNLGPLERAGLIISKPGDDRREKLLHLTPAGVRQSAAARPQWLEAQEKMLQHLGRKRWQQLLRLLQYSEEVLADN